jgi:hypothetical protein
LINFTSHPAKYYFKVIEKWKSYSYSSYFIPLF